MEKNKKNMGKNKKKKNEKNKQEQKVVPKSVEKVIDEKNLTQAIVKAYQVIEEQKKKEEAELIIKAKKEWQEIIGQKEYPENEKWYLKKIHALRNDFYALWNFLFFKSKNVKDLRMTISLMQLAIIGIFKVCKWCLYLT